MPHWDKIYQNHVKNKVMKQSSQRWSLNIQLPLKDTTNSIFGPLPKEEDRTTPNRGQLNNEVSMMLNV
jgi:hypothetical protein